MKEKAIQNQFYKGLNYNQLRDILPLRKQEWDGKIIHSLEMKKPYRYEYYPEMIYSFDVPETQVPYPKSRKETVILQPWGFLSQHPSFDIPISKEGLVSAISAGQGECLVLFEEYLGTYIVSLIKINPGGYTVLSSLNVYSLLNGGYPISASWSYENNCFIVFSNNNYTYEMYEISIASVSQLMAQYEFSGEWGGHDDPKMFHSYGNEGERNKIWLGFDEYYSGYYYILPLDEKYRFGSYSGGTGLMQITVADCESYHHGTWNVPTLSWLTNDDVRILKPVTNDPANWYGQANQRACEVQGKIAVIYDEDISEGNAAMAIHLCESYTDQRLTDGNGKSYTAATYLDTFNVVKRSTIRTSGSSTTYGHMHATYVPATPPIEEINLESVSDPWYENGIPYVTVIFNIYDGVNWGQVRTDFYYYPEGEYLVEVTYEGFVISPPDTSSPVTVLDPDGNPHDLAWAGGGSIGLVTVAWLKYTSTFVNRETYFDMRYVNNNYVVLRDDENYDYNLFVMNNEGTELYEIPLNNASSVITVRLERVIVK